MTTSSTASSAPLASTTSAQATVTAPGSITVMTPAQPAPSTSASSTLSSRTRPNVRHTNPQARSSIEPVLNQVGLSSQAIKVYMRLQDGAGAGAGSTVVGPAALPPLPPTVVRMAGFADAGPLQGEAARRAYEELAVDIPTPPANSRRMVVAPVARMFAPTEDLTKTLVTQPSAPAADAPQPDVARQIIDATSVYPVLATRYGGADLVSRVHGTVSTLATTSHWVERLSRALVVADQSARTAAAPTALKDIDRLFVEAVDTAQHHYTEALAAEDTIGRLQKDQDVDRRRIKRLHEQVQQLQAQVDSLRAANAASVGSVEEVVSFLADNTDSRTCDPDVLRFAMDACRRGDPTGMDTVNLMAIPVRGHVVPKVPVSVIQPAPSSAASSLPSSGPLAEGTIGTEPAPVSGKRSKSAPGQRTSPASNLSYVSAQTMLALAGTTESQASTVTVGAESETRDKETPTIDYGSVDADSGAETSVTEPALPTHVVEEPKPTTTAVDVAGARDVDMGGAGGEILSGSKRGFSGSATTSSASKRHQTTKVTVPGVPNPDDLVAAADAGPTTNIDGAPMPLFPASVPATTIPAAPALADLAARYTWLRQTPGYKHDLVVMAFRSPDQPGLTPDVVFEMAETDISFTVSPIMGLNLVIGWSPGFDPAKEPRKMRDKLNGIRVQRDSKFPRPEVTMLFLPVSFFFPSYVVTKIDSSAARVDVHSYLELVSERPWDQMWRDRVKRLYLIDPTTLDVTGQQWLVRYLMFMFHHRQAFWEHYHWLHTGSKNVDEMPEWKIILKRRDKLAQYFLHAWKALFALRPKSWPDHYDELLMAEPAFWFRPATHCTWVPDRAKLHQDPPVTLLEQVLELDAEEPIRVQYAGFTNRFVESLSVTAMAAFRHHHYIGVSWRLPVEFEDPDFPKLIDNPYAIGTPGPTFYELDFLGEAGFKDWKSRADAVIHWGKVVTGQNGGGAVPKPVRDTLHQRWDPDLTGRASRSPVASPGATPRVSSEPATQRATHTSPATSRSTPSSPRAGSSTDSRCNEDTGEKSKVDASGKSATAGESSANAGSGSDEYEPLIDSGSDQSSRDDDWVPGQKKKKKKRVPGTSKAMTGK